MLRFPFREAPLSQTRMFTRACCCVHLFDYHFFMTGQNISSDRDKGVQSCIGPTFNEPSVYREIKRWHDVLMSSNQLVGAPPERITCTDQSVPMSDHSTKTLPAQLQQPSKNDSYCLVD